MPSATSGQQMEQALFIQPAEPARGKPLQKLTIQYNIQTQISSVLKGSSYWMPTLLLSLQTVISAASFAEFCRCSIACQTINKLICCYLHICHNKADWMSETVGSLLPLGYWMTLAPDSHLCRVGRTCRRCHRTVEGRPFSPAHVFHCQQKST